jgi:hypothetical protein
MVKIKMSFVINSEKEDEVDLYYCVSPEETDGCIRDYLEKFPMMDEEMLLLLELSTRGNPEYNERFIKVAQEMVDERNKSLIKNFGKNKVKDELKED